MKRKGNDILAFKESYNKLLIGTECTYASLYVEKTSWTDFKMLYRQS